MVKIKKVLTTGDISKICCVSPKTAQRWFDTGEISGYVLPGSKDRRVPVKSLINFMNRNNIPLEFLEEYEDKT